MLSVTEENYLKALYKLSDGTHKAVNTNALADLLKSTPASVTDMIKKLHERADRVLIDAPCSGLGVLKRNPDAKWKLKPEFIDNIRKVQAEVLESYAPIVKPGGKLVYATCSVLPSENQEQVKKFLTTEIGKNFTFVQDKKVLAHESGYDGFYMALLTRNK